MNQLHGLSFVAGLLLGVAVGWWFTDAYWRNDAIRHGVLKEVQATNGQGDTTWTDVWIDYRGRFE